MFDFLKGKNGKYSLTKISATIFGVAGVLVTLPAGTVPLAVVSVAKTICAIAAATGAAGVKNAIDKAK